MMLIVASVANMTSVGRVTNVANMTIVGWVASVASAGYVASVANAPAFQSRLYKHGTTEGSVLSIDLLFSNRWNNLYQVEQVRY